VNDRIREWIAAYVATLRVPLEQLEVRDEDAVTISSSEEAVRVGHVNDRAAFHAVFISNIEADVILHVEFPQAFVVLEGEAE
jgi:hypothetical protein